MAETKIIYHIDEEETPYLVKLTVSPEKVTLADFKNVLNNRPVNSYKFFFKSMDQDFGWVRRIVILLVSMCLVLFGDHTHDRLSIMAVLSDHCERERARLVHYDVAAVCIFAGTCFELVS